MNTTGAYHIPALLQPTIDALSIKENGVYVDATFGGGGHSAAILQQLGPQGRLFGFDQDLDALANQPNDPRFTFVHSNFAFIENFMRFYGVEKVDGILADLGVSFHHFDTAERGFSFRANGELDMRMNREGGRTAADLINDLPEKELTRLLQLYGELNNAQRIARAIAAARSESPIATTDQLVAIVEPLLNPRQVKKEMAQLFQAFRIEVNDEMRALKRLLESSLQVLKPGGRLAIITYHSLEDRLVKNFFKSGNLEGVVEKDFFGRVTTPWSEITRKPIVASPQEVEANPRSRSAKLRCASFK